MYKTVVPLEYSTQLIQDFFFIHQIQFLNQMNRWIKMSSIECSEFKDERDINKFNFK